MSDEMVVNPPAQQISVPDQDPEERVAQLTRELQKQVREPFKRALQRLLKFRPTDKALQEFANKSPDRWAQAISIMGNLAGYQPGINVTLTVKNVGEMSDAELLKEYRDTATKIAALARGASGEVVDADIISQKPLPVMVSGPETKGE
jgi:hypothetical protein